MKIGKNKNVLYILAPIVCLVWGMVFYRLLSNKNAEPNIPLQAISTDSEVETPATFSLILDYPNPFLKPGFEASGLNPYPPSTILPSTTLPSTIQSPTHPTIPSNHPSTNQPSTNQPKWPSIQYLGKLQVVQVGEQLALISMDGKFHKVRLGSVVNGVAITSVWEDSIRLGYQSSTMVVKKVK